MVKQQEFFNKAGHDPCVYYSYPFIQTLPDEPVPCEVSRQLATSTSEFIPKHLAAALLPPAAISQIA